MFAVVRTGGKQYKVAVGDVLDIESLRADPGSTVQLGEVLMVADGAQVQVGTPVLGDATVRATVVSHVRGPKIEIFKFKAKKRYRKHQGHRQDLTRVKVDEILAEGITPQAASVQDTAVPQERTATEEGEA